MEYRFEIIERTDCYRGFFRMQRYRVRHELFAGGWGRELTRELLERGRAASVLPYDPDLDSVVVLEQFRIGAIASGSGAWLLEFVAGIIEEGEDAEGVVTREAVEEAGCEVRDLIPIARYYPSPGGSSEEIELFCGRVDSRDVGGIHGVAEEGEDIRVHVLPFDQAWALLQGGRLNSAAPIIAMQWLALNRADLRRQWPAR